MCACAYVCECIYIRSGGIMFDHKFVSVNKVF